MPLQTPGVVYGSVRKPSNPKMLYKTMKFVTRFVTTIDVVTNFVGTSHGKTS